MVIEKNFNGNGMKSLAIFSDDEKYRYILRRLWDDTKGKIVFIGLNPSTADEVKNDPTVSRMISFSKSHGFGSITVCNLFAFRATFPSDLKKSQDPIGEENDYFILKEISDSDKIVACWGNHGKFLERSKNFLKNLNKFSYFEFTNLGEPRHMLYLRKDADLKDFDKSI